MFKRDFKERENAKYYNNTPPRQLAFGSMEIHLVEWIDCKMINMYNQILSYMLNVLLIVSSINCAQHVKLYY